MINPRHGGWLLSALAASRAQAHTGESTDAVSITLLALAALVAVAYLFGISRLWRQAGAGSGTTRERAAAFLAGLVVLAVASSSPFERVVEHLFSVHMAQHLLLVMLAAPLLMLGFPAYTISFALPLPIRRALFSVYRLPGLRQLGFVLAGPLVAWSLFAVVFWVWHAPVLYQAALQHKAIHLLEHATMLGSALLYWNVVTRRARRLQPVSATLYYFTTAVQGSLLGALITFAPVVLYPLHGQYAGEYGLSALQDQQLAGLIMWIPVGGLFAILAATVLMNWLSRAEELRSSDL